MATNPPKRPAAYIRVYDVNPPSEQDQLRRCQEKACGCGYVIDPRYVIVDGQGIEPSYTKLGDLRNLVRSGRASAVFVWSKQELAQGQEELLAEIMDEFEWSGVELIEVEGDESGPAPEPGAPKTRPV